MASNSIFTDSFSMYNTNFSNVRLGFINERGFISISPVFEKFKGRKPKKGMTMYDRDNSAFFYMRTEELLNLYSKWKDIKEGGEPFELVVDGGNNKMTQKLIVGVNVFDLSEETSKKSKQPALQIFIQKFDEYDAGSDEESEPLESFVYESGNGEFSMNLLMFETWLEIMVKFVSSGLVTHIAKLKDSGFNRFNRDGASSRGGRFQRGPSSHEDDDDFGDDDTPKRRRASGSRFDDDADDDDDRSSRPSIKGGGRFQRRPSAKNRAGDDDAFEDDEVADID